MDWKLLVGLFLERAIKQHGLASISRFSWHLASVVAHAIFCRDYTYALALLTKLVIVEVCLLVFLE